MLIGGAILSLHWTVPGDVHHRRQCGCCRPTILVSIALQPRINRHEKRGSWPGQKSSFQKSLQKVAHQIYLQGTNGHKVFRNTQQVESE